MNRNPYVIFIAGLLCGSAVTVYFMKASTEATTPFANGSSAAVAEHIGSGSKSQEQPPATRTDSTRKNPTKPQGLASIQSRFDLNFDPMIMTFDVGQEFTAEDIAEYNSLHVIPYQKPQWQTECQRIDFPDHLGSYRNDCEHTNLLPPHPYQDIEIVQLEELAHADPVAAIFMGKRTESNEAKIQWHLRASALSGKSGPVLTVAERYFSSIRSKAISKDGIVDQVNFETAIIRLALEQVADQMLDPRAKPERWKTDLSSIGGELTPQLIDASDDLADRFLSVMAEIQTQVTGSSQIQRIILTGDRTKCQVQSPLH